MSKRQSSLDQFFKLSSSKQSSSSNEQCKETPIDSAISLNKTGQIMLKIHAKPGAKKSIVTDIGTQEVGIAIAALPRKGQANEELVETIAKILGLNKSEIRLDKVVREPNRGQKFWWLNRRNCQLIKLRKGL
uniref:Uncharacterized protein n=1 Tax=Acrobeloides nanus TaxID=290746 RepID=A0A914DUZ2_9BILA